MTELDQALANAYTSRGKQEDVNKVYLILLRTSLYVPIKKTDPALNHVNEEEPFTPLFAKVEDNYFMLAFDTIERLKAWAGDQLNEIDYVEIIGKDVLAGINDKAHLCLNAGTQHYKEFSPDEIVHLKKIVARIDQMKGA